MCGQRFVQAVASLVLIVESSHRYQNVATSVYFNLKKNFSRFWHILALKFHFRQLWFLESAFRWKSDSKDFYAFRSGKLIFDDGTTKFYENVVKLEYFNLKKQSERFWLILALKFQFRTFALFESAFRWKSDSILFLLLRAYFSSYNPQILTQFRLNNLLY